MNNTLTLFQAYVWFLLTPIAISTTIWGCLMLKKVLMVTKELLETQQEHEEKDRVLNYVLRTFNLHVQDPYVQRPVYDEKRCYHCHIPEGFKHADDCSWFLCQPLVTKLYFTPTQK
jgi:hypothetical protein